MSLASFSHLKTHLSQTHSILHVSIVAQEMFFVTCSSPLVHFSDHAAAVYPFGLVSLGDLQRGKTVLDALANCFLQKNMSAVADLSSQFYEFVPTYSRLVAPSIIDDFERRNWFSEFIDFLMKIWHHANRKIVPSIIGTGMTLNHHCHAVVDEYCPYSFSSHV